MVSVRPTAVSSSSSSSASSFSCGSAADLSSRTSPIGGVIIESHASGRKLHACDVSGATKREASPNPRPPASQPNLGPWPTFSFPSQGPGESSPQRTRLQLNTRGARNQDGGRERERERGRTPPRDGAISYSCGGRQETDRLTPCSGARTPSISPRSGRC